MKKQNLLVLGIAVALIVVVAVFAAVAPQKRTISETAPAVITTEAPATAAPATEAPATEAPAAQSAATEAPAAEPQATEAPADAAEPSATEIPPAEAYLVVSVGGAIYEPLPLLGEGAFTLKQDENTTNTVHVTRDSVWMEHSTCDNQDCVEQGTVTLDNMETRVLYNMIVCLPNEVVLELHTPETLASAFGLTLTEEAPAE